MHTSGQVLPSSSPITPVTTFGFGFPEGVHCLSRSRVARTLMILQSLMGKRSSFPSWIRRRLETIPITYSAILLTTMRRAVPHRSYPVREDRMAKRPVCLRPKTSCGRHARGESTPPRPMSAAKMCRWALNSSLRGTTVGVGGFPRQGAIAWNGGAGRI